MTTPTFITVSDASFFPGTVATINSLAAHGHTGRFRVVDTGLAPAQRRALESVAEVVDVDPADQHPYKALFASYKPEDVPLGPVVVIDSDIIVTSPLDDLIDLARDGRVVAFADLDRGRWEPSWADVFELPGPLPAPRPYINAGVICFDTRRWPGLLSSHQRAAVLVQRALREPERWPGLVGHEDDLRRWPGDQDAWNAVLATSVPEEQMTVLDPSEQLLPGPEAVATRVDLSGVTCTVADGRRPRVLHYVLRPKPWMRSGWWRIRRDAYVRLLPRLLAGGDVLLQLTATDVPIWLHPGVRGSVARRTLHLIHGLGDRLRRRLPRSLGGRLQRAKAAYQFRRG